MENKDLRIQAVTALLSLNPLIRRNLFGRINKTIKNINRTQFMIMVYLMEHNESCMGAVAEKAAVSSSQLTGLISELEQMGYVERETSLTSRRMVNVKITQKGREYMQKDREELHAALLPIFEGVSDEDIITLKQCSESIIGILARISEGSQPK